MDLRRKVKRVHFVGIGGIGQSIAEVLHAQDFEVTGSDLNGGSNVERLPEPRSPSPSGTKHQPSRAPVSVS